MTEEMFGTGKLIYSYTYLFTVIKIQSNLHRFLSPSFPFLEEEYSIELNPELVRYQS
jgi:hypothetical protein